MKKTYLLLLLLILSMVSKAQILGGEINYRCLGNDKYEVFIDLVASCTTQLSIPKIYVLAHKDTAEADSMAFVESKMLNVRMTHCAIPDSCDDFTFSKTRFRGVFDLSPFSACSYFFYCKEANNVPATTVSNRSTFCVFTELNTCATPCGNSPQRKKEAPIKVAHNQDLIVNFSHNAEDFPGDSFAYRLNTALEDINQPVTYGGNFSSLLPLTFFGFPNNNLQWPAGLRLDPITGDFMLRPTASNQIGPVVVIVERHRMINGVMLLIERKSVENLFHIVPSTGNKAPKILPPNSKQACAGEKTCMTIQVDDDDIQDTIQVEFTLPNVPGLELIPLDTVSKHPRYQVCITPDEKMAKSNMVSFLVAARDNACPMQGTANRSFTFFTRPIPAKLDTVILDPCGKTKVSVNLQETTWGNNAWRFTDSATQQVTLLSRPLDSFNLKAGTYYLNLSIQSSIPCFYHYYDTLHVSGPVYPNVLPSAKLNAGCIGTETNIGTHISDADANYTWDDGYIGGLRPIFMNEDTVRYILTSSRASCQLIDTFWVDARPYIQPKFTASWIDSTSIQGRVDSIISGVNYVWTIHDTLAIPGTQFFIQNLNYGPIKVSLQASNGPCISYGHSILQFAPPPPPLSIALNSENNPFQIYPNPFKEEITLAGEEISSATLFNALGQSFSVSIEMQGPNQIIRPLETLPKGMYWLRLESPSGIYLEKVVKE